MVCKKKPEGFVKANNVWVVEHFHDFNLIFEHAQFVRLNLVQVNRFDCYALPRNLMRTLLYFV